MGVFGGVRVWGAPEAEGSFPLSGPKRRGKGGGGGCSQGSISRACHPPCSEVQGFEGLGVFGRLEGLGCFVRVGRGRVWEVCGGLGRLGTV